MPHIQVHRYTGNTVRSPSCILASIHSHEDESHILWCQHIRDTIVEKVVVQQAVPHAKLEILDELHILQRHRVLTSEGDEVQ